MNISYNLQKYRKKKYIFLKMSDSFREISKYDLGDAS